MRLVPAVMAVLAFLGPLALGGQESMPDAPVAVQAPENATHPGEALEVSLLTVGQGDVVWERFGHNAIVFSDINTGQEMAYHWGVFNFGQVDFIPRLIKGTMLYGMGGEPLESSLASYRYTGRPAWKQELALTPAQRWDLFLRVRENALPENRDYRYDYYRDNCSTRIRDHLDAVLGGVLEHRFAADTTEHSYRWHTRRILQAMPAYYLGIQFVLGPHGDVPITVWEEMFLPLTLRDRLREVMVSDGVGGSSPLVKSETLVLDADRPPPPSDVPFALPLFVLGAVVWGGALLWASGGNGPVSSASRIMIVLLAGAWCILAGVGGTLLLGAWAFTDHYFWYENFNLFQVNPGHLALAVALLVFLVSGRMPGWGRWLARSLGLLALVGVFIELIPGLGQRHLEVLGLTLPMALALWVAVDRCSQRSSSP